MLYLAGVNVTAETKPVKQYQLLTKRVPEMIKNFYTIVC